MNIFSTKFSTIVVLMLAIILVINLLSNLSVLGQSSLSNAEIINLRSRVTRLESEVQRLNQSIAWLNSSVNTPRTNNNPSPIINSPVIIDHTPVGRSDPMFEKLATLVIELKERVNKIEQKLDIGGYKR